MTNCMWSCARGCFYVFKCSRYDNKPILFVIVNKKINWTIWSRFSKISLKAKSIYKIKDSNIIESLDAYVNNIQEDLDKLNERNGPSDIYDDTQFKSLERCENAVKILHH